MEQAVGKWEVLDPVQSLAAAASTYRSVAGERNNNRLPGTR